jgi:chromosome segregation ATPase
VRQGLSVIVAVAFLGCSQQRERAAPVVDRRDAHLSQLQHENERLIAERNEAYQTSAELDATLRGVEHDLGAITGIDADIGKLRRNIETGIGDKPARPNVRSMMEKLRKMLQQRREIVERAQTGVNKANQQALTVNEGLRKRYKEQIEQFATLIQQQVAENARLRDERDDLARKYVEAASDAKEARAEVATIATQLDEERGQREEAERTENRVLVLVAKNADLRRKGVVTGRWYQHKTAHCSCTGCFTEYDRRTLTSLRVPAPLSNARLYTTHPPKSFTLHAEGPSQAVLEIVDAEKFWSSARCMVVGF